MDCLALRDVTAEDIAAYWRDGVVHLPNIIDLGWAERMRVALDRILDEPSQRFDADVNPEGTPGRFNIALPWNPDLKDGDPFPPDNDLFPQVWPRPVRVPEIRAAE